MKFLIRIAPMLVGLALVAEARTWTSVSGKQLEAEYVSQAYGRVTLKSPQGEMFNIQLAKLSAEDQTYLRDRARPAPTAASGRTAAATAAAVPPAPRPGSPEVLTQMIPGQTFMRTAAGKSGITYHVRVPPTYKSGDALPLFIAFSAQGKGRSALNAISASTDKAGWIAIGCDKLMNSMDLSDTLIDEMEDELLEDIYHNVPHDPHRVYLGGHSGGGMRAYGITARRAEPFAGVLAFGGWLGGPDFQTKTYCRHMAVAMLNGAQDESANSWVESDTKALELRKCHVKLFAYPGGHSTPTPTEVTDECIRWLEEDWKTHGSQAH